MKYYMAVNLHNVNMPKFFKNCRIKKNASYYICKTFYDKYAMSNLNITGM